MQEYEHMGFWKSKCFVSAFSCSLCTLRGGCLGKEMCYAHFVLNML